MSDISSVLMIAYYFPPMGGAGVQRTLKFVKYLPEFGWKPSILTVSAQSHFKDNSLVEEVPPGLSITRTPILHPPLQLPWRLRSFISRWVLVVDEQIGWLPFAVKAGCKVIEQGNIKVIYSTSSPYTNHLIALQLHCQTGLPWVADFRDPWIQNHTIKFATIVHRWVNELLERKVISEAERVIFNTSRAEKSYQQTYSLYSLSKFITIPNGYDQDDLPDTDPVTQNKLIFTVAHLGSLYRKTRSSEYFLKALQQVIQNEELPVNKVRVHFIGNVDKETHVLVKQYGLGEIVELSGYKPHREALSQLCAADLMLLIPTYGIGSELFIPAKLYEYLACQKPILCLADPGACADLVLGARAGSVVPPTDTDKIAIELVRFFHLWEKGELSIKPDLDLVNSFERRKLTSQLANVLSSVIK
jgi:glycosyltransferase involved in cell wall biosynthesis